MKMLTLRMSDEEIECVWTLKSFRIIPEQLTCNFGKIKMDLWLSSGRGFEWIILYQKKREMKKKGLRHESEKTKRCNNVG